MVWHENQMVADFWRRPCAADKLATAKKSSGRVRVGERLRLVQGQNWTMTGWLLRCSIPSVTFAP